jgi:hypothetical protein
MQDWPWRSPCLLNDPVMHADRHWCTWMYETRNETAQIDPHPLVVTPGLPGGAVQVTACGPLLGTAPRWGSKTRRPRMAPLFQAGVILGFSRNRFVGSYRAFSWRRR